MNYDHKKFRFINFLFHDFSKSQLRENLIGRLINNKKDTKRDQMIIHLIFMLKIFHLKMFHFTAKKIKL